MTTPQTMDRLLGRLRVNIEDAEIEAKESYKEAIIRNGESFVAGFARGYADALKEVWAGITGDKFK
jgi:hypothetical protein